MSATVDAVPAPRLHSLDALRGFDMLWIVGADALGSALARLQGGWPVRFLARQMEHAAWQGFHGAIAAVLDALWPGLGGLTLALVGVGLCIAVCRFLYRRRIFIRI